jgi:hypothetical protein
MNYKAIAEYVELNAKTVRYLEKAGILSNPLTEENIFFMQSLAVIWKSEEFMRLLIANLSMARRARLLFGSGYTKPERYMIHRLLGHYSDKEDGGTYTLHISQLVDEVMVYYKLPQSTKYELTATAYKLRKKICNMRYNNMDLVEISKALTTLRKPKPAKPKSSPKKPQFSSNDIFGY